MSPAHSGKLTIRLRRPLLAHGFLAVGVSGSIGFLAHYPALKFRDLAILCVVGLFTWLALSKKPDSDWVRCVFIPAFGLLLFVVFYAYVFTIRVDAPFLPSVLSQRQYSFFLLGPIVYMLYLRGWRMEDFQRIFVASTVLVVISQVFYDTVVSGNSLLLSGQFFVLDLGEATENSSATRTANIGAMFAVLYFSRRLFQSREVPMVAFSLSMVTVSTLLLLVAIPRGLLTAAGAALLVYALWLARPDRARLAAIMLPLYAALVALLWSPVREYFLGMFGEDKTWAAREDTAASAWESFREYPLLGFGSDSVYSISFRDIFGDGFWVSDIGLLGVLFQYGLLGVGLYVFLVGWLCAAMIGMRWSYAGRVSRERSVFIWALFAICLVFVLTSPLQARFIYSVGLPIGAFCWGLVMAHRRELSLEQVSDTPEQTEAARRLGGRRAPGLEAG